MTKYLCPTCGAVDCAMREKAKGLVYSCPYYAEDTGRSGRSVITKNVTNLNSEPDVNQ